MKKAQLNRIDKLDTKFQDAATQLSEVIAAATSAAAAAEDFRQALKVCKQTLRDLEREIKAGLKADADAAKAEKAKARVKKAAEREKARAKREKLVAAKKSKRGRSAASATKTSAPAPAKSASGNTAGTSDAKKSNRRAGGRKPKDVTTGPSPSIDNVVDATESEAPQQTHFPADDFDFGDENTTPAV